MTIQKRNCIFWHIMFIVLTIGMIFVAMFLFSHSYIQLFEAVIDFISTLFYYILDLLKINLTVEPAAPPPVAVAPELPADINLPQSSNDFFISLELLFKSLFDASNFMNFIQNLILFINNFLIVALMILPFVFLLKVFANKQLSKTNNDYNIDTKPLRAFKKIIAYTYIPLKQFLISFKDFYLVSKYKKFWFFIWILNFNIPAIFINFFAYYLYFASSLDVVNLYSLFLRLVINVTTPLRVIPPWLQSVFAVIIVVFLLVCFRKKYALNVLRRFELRNRKFIDSLPISSMMVGAMGKKKTTLLTDIALSQSVIFRNKAFELLLENDMKFPKFPWINFELELKRRIEQHDIYNLASCREYVKNVAKMFRLINTDEAAAKSWIKRCRKKPHNNPDFIFGYDYNLYGFIYDNKLEIKNIFEILEVYAQLYFIYIIESSLLLSNFSIREDTIKNDLGNLPLWDNDYFTRNSKYLDEYSRYAHILDFDALRLGKKVLENNKFADSYDFGIILITEAGKERGNQYDVKGEDKKSDEANRLNDGFNRFLKMIRHSSTVDNYPFARVFMDEQRPESLGADVRSLCELIHIRETSAAKMPVPFFFLDELLYNLFFSNFESYYLEQRFNRGDNTLFTYIFKKIAGFFHAHYKRMYNQYSYYTLDVETERGTQDSVLEQKRYYIMPKKIYSKRFSTDCFSDFFAIKSLASCVGISDIKEYKTVRATMDELDSQHSFFIKDIKADLIGGLEPLKQSVKLVKSKDSKVSSKKTSFL